MASDPDLFSDDENSKTEKKKIRKKSAKKKLKKVEENTNEEMGNILMSNKNLAKEPLGNAKDADSVVPKTVPTIVELKKSLPAHCFQPNIWLSFYFVLKDLAIVSALFYLIKTLDDNLMAAKFDSSYFRDKDSVYLGMILRGVYFPIYWYLQGTMMWALFVLGHDCGHSSFSNSNFINDFVGNILHSVILVPYYPWKMSHQHHHKNTGNIDKDEIFYPVREKDYSKEAGSTCRGAEGGKRFIPYFGFGISWFFYLFKGYAPRESNHFNPFDPLFTRKTIECSISLLVIAAWITFFLAPFAKVYGFTALTIYYIIPVLVFASWLVVVTFLHHQDERVPWYADEVWDFVRGNLSSVDRHYGWAHDLVHNIGTHQIHHLFSKIPHYRLEEATAVFREKYPELVRKSDERILPAFFKMFNLFESQQWIKDDTKIHYYETGKVANGIKRE